MLESKRLPREMVLQTKLSDKECDNKYKNETPAQNRARQSKCNQLYRNLQGMLSNRDGFIKNKNQLFHKIKRLLNELKRLTNDAAFNRKLGGLFDAVSLVLSGGSASVVRRAAAEVIGVIGTIVGLNTHERQIRQLVRKIETDSFEYEGLSRAQKSNEKNIAKHYRMRKDICCKPDIVTNF